MVSIAVVGGGFAGVGAVRMLRRAGYEDVAVFERAPRVGGVWHHNTYPGAACDVPSHLYEFSFAPNPRWSRRYAPQPEIQRYLEDVARSYGVRDRIKTGVEVTEATWDEDRARWRIQTSAGEHEADVLLTGCTSWYLDENGHDPNQWPWRWSTYRRRTAELAPAVYELGYHTRQPALAA